MKNLFKIGSLLGIGLTSGFLFKEKRAFMEEKFKFRKDEFEGIHITTDNFKYESGESFKKIIEDFITKEKGEGHKISSVWVKLSPENAHLSEVLNSMGFDIHHSQDQYIMFNKWMKQHKPNKIPLYSTHYLSCAPVVLSDDNHILVQKRGGKWGVPVDTLKTIGMKLENVARDTIDETLGQSNSEKPTLQFQDTLLIREITKTQSGHPDILFAMQFKSNQRYPLAKKEDRELQWVPLDNLALFIRDNKEQIHYPLHYLILERVNTLYEQKILDVPNPDSKKFDYYYKIFNSYNAIFPML